MARTSRGESRKEQRRRSNGARESSESEEERSLKDRKRREEVGVKGSRDRLVGEKRKLVSRSQDGDSSEDYVASKRRRGTRRESSENDSEKRFNSKASIELKSKSGRSNDGVSESKEENKGLLTVDSKEKRTGSVKDRSKHNSEKYLYRNDANLYKDRNVRREKSVDTLVRDKVVSSSEFGRKQGGRPVKKREVENSDWQMKDGHRFPELGKDLERCIRRRGGSDDKDNYQGDLGDGNDRQLSSREDRTKDGKPKDKRSDRDKLKNDGHGGKHEEDLDRDHRHQNRRTLRDHASNRPDTGSKHYRNEPKLAVDNLKKSKTQGSDYYGSADLDDQGIRCKDNLEKKRSSNGKEVHRDHKSKTTCENLCDLERSLSSSKVESFADRGRSQTRQLEVGSTFPSSRWKCSPDSSAHVAEYPYRHSSKQAESNYKGTISRERAGSNITSSRVLSGVHGQKSRHRSFTPSMNIDRTFLIGSDVRQSIGIDEMGTGSSKNYRECAANEDRGNRLWTGEKPAADDACQADGYMASVSSSLSRTSHFLGNSSSHVPPPALRTGINNPLLGSLEENAGSHYKSSDHNIVGKGQGIPWKSVPTLRSPLTNDFIPFQHGPPGRTYPVMPQFSVPHLFDVRAAMELNHSGISYDIPDVDKFSSYGNPFSLQNSMNEECPRPFHGWTGSTNNFRNQSQMHGRSVGDQNSHLIPAGEMNLDIWKGHNVGRYMKLPVEHKEDHLLHAAKDEVLTGHSAQSSKIDCNRSHSRTKDIEIQRLSVNLQDENAAEVPPETISEKMPEPSKRLDNVHAHSCHAYLSKLDVSVDLTHSELYARSLRLLDRKGSATVDEDAFIHLYPEETREAGIMISSNPLNISFFPKIDDSIFQRAITLYKKQREGLKFKHPNGPHALAQKKNSTNNEEKPESVSDADHEKPDTVLASKREKPESGPASHGEKPVLVKTSDQENEEEQDSVLNHEKVEEPVPTSNQGKADSLKAAEPHTICGEDKPEEPDSASAPTNVNTLMTSPLEKLEVAVNDSFSFLQHGAQATCHREPTSFSDTIRSPLGFLEPIECCKLVNSSRIRSP